MEEGLYLSWIKKEKNWFNIIAIFQNRRGFLTTIDLLRFAIDYIREHLPICSNFLQFVMIFEEFC
jgi:hypothetical protein